MKKITFFVLSLNYGGAERSITDICNVLSKTNEVEIISIYKIFDQPAYELNSNIKIKYLLEDLKPNKELFFSTLKRLQFISAIKEAIKSIKILYYKRKYIIEELKVCNSDVFVTTRKEHNYYSWKYGNKKAIKIGQEHNDIRQPIFTRSVKKGAKGLDYFVTVSEDLTKFYNKTLAKYPTRVVKISNMINYIPKNKSNLENKNIISIGRLSKEKGYEDLIKVFSLVALKRKDWQLNILGDGVKRKDIERIIKNRNLEKSVNLHGYVQHSDLKKHLLNSSIFVMTSQSESFGIAILEAAAYGIPAVVFDSAKGYLEIIENNHNGVIIKNRSKSDMANAIIDLMDDYDLRKTLGDNAKKELHKYNSETISKKWNDLINDVKKPEDSDKFDSKHVTDKIKRYVSKVKRDGFINATKKSLVKLKIDYLSSVNILSNIHFRKNEKKITEILNNIIVNAEYDRLIIWRSGMGWNVPLFQRPQHLSLAFAKKKTLIFYEVSKMTDDINYLKEHQPNLYLINFENANFRKLFKSICDKVKTSKYIYLSSASTELRLKTITEYTNSGYRLLYDYLDDLNPKINSMDSLPLNIVKIHDFVVENPDKTFVICTADILLEDIIRKRNSDKNIVFACNGVTYDHFAIQNNDYQISKDFQQIIAEKKAIIGYYGALASWFDYELIYYLAKQTDYNIVLIGPKYDDSFLEKDFQKYPNIHHLGVKPYDNLPYYAKEFDVCILPFVLNEITEATSPLKAFEYMALGKPIVSTNMRECRKYKSIMVAETKEEFILQIKTAINRKNDNKYKALLKKEAQENCWDNKANDIIEALLKTEK